MVAVHWVAIGLGAIAFGAAVMAAISAIKNFCHVERMLARERVYWRSLR